MREEIEVPPGLFGGVVHRAIGCLAVRTRQTRAALEVDLDVEPFPLGVIVGGGNVPGAIDAKSELEEMSVALAGTRVVIDPAQPEQSAKLGGGVNR